MSGPLPHVHIVIDDTYGASLLGAFATAVLYGVTTLQTYFYFVFYPKDSRSNKILIWVVWALDTVQMILVIMCMYHYLITNYSNPSVLPIGHWTLFISLLFNLIIACIVQSFFAFRIFYLSPPRYRWYLLSAILVLVLAHFIFGLVTVVFMLRLKELARLQEITIFAATPFAIFAVLSDIIIAAALCILLHGSKTGIKRTNALITTLIIFAINRCLLTSVVAIVEVIVFAIRPHSLWFIGLDFVIGKLYANSLLATLNSRAVIREKNSTSTGVINSIHVADSTNLSFRVQSSTRATDSRSNAFSELPGYGHSYGADDSIPLDFRSEGKTGTTSDRSIVVSTDEIVRYDYAIDGTKSQLEDSKSC
ncbi:hypothetical protein BJ165DRAFT_1494415 [Panaeolus papilionaceus]|nr:hypothetical protein BJ165DRAFT_1494415 [Panaeolus papilionaceus]